MQNFQLLKIEIVTIWFWKGASLIIGFHQTFLVLAF